jgi:hypothetical protein
MEQKEIIIKIEKDVVLFNPKSFIRIENTSIPKDLRFRTNENIYWKVEILDYDLNEKCLKVKVVDYKPNDQKRFTRQTTKKEIEKLIFIGKYDWAKLCPLLMWYIKNKFIDQLYNTDAFDIPSSEKQSQFLNIHTNDKHKTPVVSKIINEEFSVNFNDAQFKLGYVSFKKPIKVIGKNIEFKITNDNILPEFDNIKYWFSKKLKTKKFHVKASLKLSGNNTEDVTATSKEIDMISPEIIESVKYARTIALTKQPSDNTLDKSLFTSNDIFSQIDSDDIEGNVFKQGDQDILGFLIADKAVRNKKQLAYLAGAKQSVNHPIHYTLYPHFGFLFLVEGSYNNHFIWELLNSHATYIWTFNKSEKEVHLQFKRIENIINTIRASGREKYKTAYSQTHQDNDLVFRVLNHKAISSELVDEFPIWKSKLNEQLT